MGVKLLAGIGGPLAMIVLWALFGAPSASVSLHGVARVGFQIVWFGLGVLALAGAGRKSWALWLAVLTAVNLILAEVWHQQK